METIRRNPSRKIIKRDNQTESALLILTAFIFLAGGIIGFLCLQILHALSFSSSGALSSCIQGFLADAKAGTLAGPAFLTASWSVLRWPLLALILCWLPLGGAIGLLLLVFCKGFILCGFLTAFFLAASEGGLFTAWLLAGIPNLILVPILFVLVIRGMVRILSEKSGGKGSIRAPLLTPRNWCQCASLLAVCIVLDVFVLPNLLPALYKWI